MSWIVNILATLIYLGFGIIYAVDFSKRKHFRYSIVVTAAAIFLAQAGMFLLFQVENWFGAMMWMSLGYVLMMLSLWVNVKMTMAVASYYAAKTLGDPGRSISDCFAAGRNSRGDCLPLHSGNLDSRK